MTKRTQKSPENITWVQKPKTSDMICNETIGAVRKSLEKSQDENYIPGIERVKKYRKKIYNVEKSSGEISSNLVFM